MQILPEKTILMGPCLEMVWCVVDTGLVRHHQLNYTWDVV